jgi:hypothetical protein
LRDERGSRGDLEGRDKVKRDVRERCRRIDGGKIQEQRRGKRQMEEKED